MSATGLHFFVNLLGLPTTGTLINFDFRDSGDEVLSNYPGNSLFSGELSSIGDFWQVPNSGYLSGQSIQIKNVESGLNSNSWTMLFIYEKIATGGGILFSNLSRTNNIYSGFTIGLNDANKLYFKTYNKDGFFIKTFNHTLPTKCLIGISKNRSAISSTNYDFNTKVALQDWTRLEGQYLFDSNQWYLGAEGALPASERESNLTGYLDSFVYLNNYLGNAGIGVLGSGFISNDGTGVVEGEVYSYGYDAVTIKNEINTGDFLSVLTKNNHDDPSLNKLAKFNNENHFVLNESNSSVKNYLNGLFQLESGYSLIGDVYGYDLNLSGDYYLSGNKILSTGFYSKNDELLYDKNISGINVEYVSGDGNDAYSSNIPINSLVFLNGQLLRSGIDYINNGGFVMLESGNDYPTGVLIGYSIQDYVLNTGSSAIIQLDRTLPNMLQVYNNGIRLTNFLQHSKFDLLNGEFNDGSYSLIYNNTKNSLE